MTSKPKPIGKRNSWFAEWNGDQLACVHEYWCNGEVYHDKWVLPGRRKCNAFVDRIRTFGRVLVTKDKVTENEGSWPGFSRQKYLFEAEVEDITYDERDGLRFRFGRTLTDFR